MISSIETWLPPAIRGRGKSSKRRRGVGRVERRVAQKRNKAGARVPEHVELPAHIKPRVGNPELSASASHVIERFGGAYKLIKALAAVGHPKRASCVYRWLYPYPKGTGGRIPRQAWIEIQIAAHHAKVSLANIRTVPVRKDFNTMYCKTGG